MSVWKVGERGVATGAAVGSEVFFEAEWKTMSGQSVCRTKGSIVSGRSTETTEPASGENVGILMDLEVDVCEQEAFLLSQHSGSFHTLDLYHSSASWRFLAATLSYCWRTSRRAAVRSGLETSTSIWTCCSWIWAWSSWISWGNKSRRGVRYGQRGCNSALLHRWKWRHLLHHAVSSKRRSPLARIPLYVQDQDVPEKHCQHPVLKREKMMWGH